MTSLLNPIPEDRRESVQTALTAAYGTTSPTALVPVTGGASGALTYRVEAGGKPYLLRVEGRRTPMRNPHQYTCMQIAADAGVAPPLRYVDDATGIAIMDFIAARPLTDFPGGQPALARAAGGLIARLQATSTFPQFVDYFTVLSRMMAFIRGSNMFAPGLLDPHMEGFERIRAAYPADTPRVSSHNDPNLRNVIFDGERLWPIDWETAYRNDPLVDVAIMLDQLEASPAIEVQFLTAWLGRTPDAALRARLLLIRPVTRLYYAGLGFAMFAAQPREKPDDDLTAPTPEEFRAAFAQGKLTATGPQTLYLLGKMQLAGFLAGLTAPGFEYALSAVKNG